MGLTPADELPGRLAKHTDGAGAAFTEENPPLGVIFLWPAAHRAVESYLFALLLEKLPEDAVVRHVRVGGWTQTLARKR